MLIDYYLWSGNVYHLNGQPGADIIRDASVLANRA
jgi:hypothetical protein